MQTDRNRSAQERLEAQLKELDARLDRITSNVRRGLDSDSEERAKQLEDSEVVDALGNEARAEIAKIKRALARIEAGDYGRCINCDGDIAAERLQANPAAESCIDCAEINEKVSAAG